ncbi:MAG: carboxypeptidase regulatory-like domain-containing protein, partial [Methanophagales archaeon]|nr:carboxypeptidase regulatory-like domain-containing protein [Methanophagales archaeon]
MTNMQTGAIAVKWKREVAALTLLILVLLLLSSVSGASGVRHQRYSEANASDEGIHSFFTDVLGDAGTCMDKFINESADADKFASSLESELKVTEEESRLYATKGIESNVSRVLTPFSALSGGVKKITLYQTVFLTNITILKNESDYFAYVRAKNALGNIRTGASEINSSLDGIELIELRNETSTLVFNVSESRDKLKDVYSVIDSYNEMLKKYEFKGLLVDVSNDHPFLYEEITIYIYGGNTTSSLSLVIDNTTYELKDQTAQTKKHRFDVLGEHEIYAEGVTTGEGEYITSNIVKVYVDKIPTLIYLPLKYSALLNKRVKITGLLLDYYNEPLCGVNVTVTAGGEKSELKTDKNGSFVFNGTKSFEGYLNVSAFYPGNKTHSKSGNTIISIFFRSPVSLYIKSNKTDLNVNETVNFTGSIRGIDQNHTVLLNISVNSTNMKTITVKKDFNFSLFFSGPGAYEVQAIFPGDVLFTPAESNVIRINVSEERVIFTKVKVLFGLLIALIIIGSIGVVMRARSVKKRREGGVAESVKINAAMEQKEKEAEGAEEIRASTLESKGVEDAYKLLFDTIVAKYRLKKSFTPRELTEKLKEEAFAEKLEKVTELYEKRVFG